MAADLSTILAEALQLPTEQRADLVSQLLASLDAPAQEETHDEWVAQIEACARRAIAGEPGTLWADALEELRAQLRRP